MASFRFEHFSFRTTGTMVSTVVIDPCSGRSRSQYSSPNPGFVYLQSAPDIIS